MNQSYWQKTTKHKKQNVVQTDMATDIVIIGGGLSGVSLAYQLKDSSKQVIVLEQDELGSHTSGHTTAKLTTLHGTLYQQIEAHYDIHQAYLYYKSNEEALHEIKKRIDDENIECDLQQVTSYIYANQPCQIRSIQKQRDIFDSFRVPYVEDEQFICSMGLTKQYIFHPLKYLYALVDICQNHHIQFFENSGVTQVERVNNHFILHVNNHSIECQYLIHATRYPSIKDKFFYMKLFQEKEYINYCCTQKGMDCQLCLDEQYSYRPLKNQHSLQITPHANQWYAMDSIPLRGIPYIGEIHNHEYVIYGFQKWGMTLSQVAAKLISDLIQERDNPYEQLYSCRYFSLSFAREYYDTFLNHLMEGYVYQHFCKEKIENIQKKDGAIIRKDGKLMAVYRDEKGEYHYFSPYCPHMKGILSFDKIHQMWICPCHQSLFDAYGKRCEGPSVKSMNKIE